MASGDELGHECIVCGKPVCHFVTSVWPHCDACDERWSCNGVDRVPDVYVFDFDGVLAIPYTSPEQLYPRTEAVLRKLSAWGHHVLVSSFNPRAYTVLQPLLRDGVIHQVRAGSAIEWWHDGGMYLDEIHRREMFKSLHIGTMLRRLTSGSWGRMHFFDDDPHNVVEVQTGLPDCRAVLIDASRGIQFEHLW